MSDTLKLKTCPKCGQPISAEAPQGLCPKCLLAQASIPTEAGKSGSAKAVPPSREDLIAAFPQLEILELIGQGGMGFVFKARQPKLERPVALKILPQSLAADPAFAERFAREGRVLARLNHPNIVTIFDFGQANGFFYLLMEYVDGVNLRQAMRAGRFTPAQALAVVPKICEALQFAHHEGILHRDIKPENILLDSKGRLKIADFGIAKLVSEPQADAALTGSGGTLGTPHYMAPEQIERPATVDHRADIYSLGVVFYEMLTGELPIGKFQPPSEKVHLDVRLDEVVLHALEKEPGRRYQHVSEVKTAVETVSSSAPPFPPVLKPAPVTASPIGAGPDRFWRRFAIVGGLVLLAMLLVPVLAILLSRERPRYLESASATPLPPMTVANTVTNVEQTEVALAQLVVDPRGHRGTHLEPGKMDWEFKCFVPPNHLARLLFVHWTKGVPAVDTGFSTYFKVGKAGGVDLFCSLSCQRIVESGEFSRLPEAGRRQSLAAWGFPESAGVTNAVRWDVNLGAGFTSSRWIAMPKYHRVSTVVPQFEFGRRLVVPLVEFDQSASGESNGWSGMELRFFLEPLKSSPIRTLPYETDMTNYVAGRGITGTMDEALQAINGNTESAELREARAKLAELRLRYTDKHPIVVELMMRIKHLEDK